MPSLRYLIALFLLALLTAPAAAVAQNSASVTGEVLYRERIALPPGALVTVRLEDVSLADAPAKVIAEQTIDPQGKGPPYAFELPFDPATIDTRFSYAVRAEIKQADQLLFTTTERYAVITQGNPSSGLQIVVRSVGTAQPAALPAELVDRVWTLAALQRTPQEVVNATDTGLTIRFGSDGRVSGSGGCNGFSGPYTVGANQQLTLGMLLSTLRACAPAVAALEQAYFEALRSVTSYTFDDTARFQLSFNNGQGALRYVITAPLETCFPETGHCVRGRFREYWQQNGGLAVFGYPLSDEASENGLQVQYFERQRFELHPENQAPYDVLLGRLGDELLRRAGTDWTTLPKAIGARAGCRYFPETQHNVCDLPGGPGFLRYWSSNGLELDGRNAKTYAESLALFGLPLSEPTEIKVGDTTVLAQWFERARFEWHPNNPAAFRVLLGRLGAEMQPGAE